MEWGLLKHHPMLNKQVTKFALKGRDRYVEDWELEAWASVANPFLVLYAQLKGVTGLRQQDLLTIERANITANEMRVFSLKSKKWLVFKLLTPEGKPNLISLALKQIDTYYASVAARKQAKPRDYRLAPATSSKWLFFNRKGGGYYNFETGKPSGFQSVWRRSMDKALAETALTERFSEHDLRGKVGSDAASDIEAQIQLAHADVKTTRKHYRRRGTEVPAARGFFQPELFPPTDG